MIIDAHNHPEWYGYNLEKFLQNMDECHIDVTWLLSWESPADEYDPEFNSVMPGRGSEGPIPFSCCLSFAERAPGRFVLGYAPDPRRPDAIDRLEAAITTYGVRVCGELKLRMMYDNPDAVRMFRFCGEKCLPVVLHLDYEWDTGGRYPRPNWWYGGGIEALRRVLEVCPDTVFLGHAPGFWAHISGGYVPAGTYPDDAYPTGRIEPGGKLIELLHEHPNLYCDVSAGSGRLALERDRDFARDFLIEFQDRVLYGRDYFDNRHQELLTELNLPAEVLEKIYSGNALKLAPTVWRNKDVSAD